MVSPELLPPLLTLSQLLSGTAEIFGTELAQNQLEPYVFRGAKAAIYTWHGCKLEVTGSCSVDYIAEETPMISYGNTHFALEALREDAVASNTLGPRVLVVGPANAGKTSLAKLLSAYAYRSGRTPVVANLDPKEGFLTIPGTISASALESIVDVSQGWGSSPITGPSQIPTKLPLVYQYGLEDPDAKPDNFKAIVRRLALSVNNRLEDDSNAKSTGCIIDTAGSMSNGRENYGIIQHIVSEFQVNVLIILGSERLYSDMFRRFSKPGVSILKLDKSGGCVDRDVTYLQQARDTQVKEYFFGSPQSMLSPHSQQISFDEVLIYRVSSESSDFLDSLLPGDDEYTSSSDKIFEKLDEPTSMMQNATLAIVQAEPTDTPETVRDSSVIGFVFISEVDDKRRKIRMLTPMTGRLPKKVLIWGTFPEPVANLLG